MSWSQFEPGFSRHPKRLKCGPEASWVWTCAIDHATSYRTDGFLDETAVASLVPGIAEDVLRKAIEALVAVKSLDPVEGGYMVHGYLEHNRSRERVEADRRASRERYDRWKEKSNGVANPLDQRVTNALPTELPNGASFIPSVLPSVLPAVASEPRPSTTLSGSTPDGALGAKQARAALTAEAQEILDFLNRKADRHFLSEVNLDFIRARLREGATVDQCRAIIGRKVAEWKGDSEKRVWLRPATLFNRTKFSQYLGELPATAFPSKANGAVQEELAAPAHSTHNGAAAK